VTLFPTANFPNKKRKTVEKYLDEINSSINVNLTHNINNFSIHLSKKESKLFALLTG